MLLYRCVYNISYLSVSSKIASHHFTDNTADCKPYITFLKSKGFVVSNGYTLQHFTRVRALNLQPVLHFTISLNNVIEIIIWKGDLLSWCPRGVFSTNWSGCLRCPSLNWTTLLLPQHLLTWHEWFCNISAWSQIAKSAQKFHAFSHVSIFKERIRCT